MTYQGKTKNLSSGQSYTEKLHKARTGMYMKTKRQKRYREAAEQRKETFRKNAPKNPIKKAFYYGYKKLKLDK